MSNLDKAILAIAFSTVSATLPAQWGHLQTSSAPAPRSRALLAYDYVGNRTLMFGGNWSNEFWSLSGGTWTQLTPATRPSARARANIATNMITGEILLYGGDTGSAQFANDETWLWDGTNWQLQAPANTPGGLARHGMAFDLVRQVNVLFGGRRNSWIPSQASDLTWEYTAGNWVQVTVNQPPPALTDMAMSYHPVLQQVMLFGGQRGGSQGASDETWIYEGTSWTRINVTGVRPAARVGASLVANLSRGVLVLFGGRDPVTMEIFNDTWEHDGVNWVKVDNVYGGIYPPRADVAVTHDFMRDRLVAFGGVDANGAMLDDTWEYGAQFQPFGMGCPGSAGVPALVGGLPARIGTTTSADITNLPPSSPVAFLAVGLSRTQSVHGSLPMQLGSSGMPGCRSYTSADQIFTLPASGGTATWAWDVPNVPSLVGQALYLQGVSWDPGVNAIGLTVSNAATLVIGH
ncbi:MAG TPA: hypothetical protein VFD82_17180 [Planctomycetota bacterium]|nr:hypothetical protein [Planctomycetota bacterium]